MARRGTRWRRGQVRRGDIGRRKLRAEESVAAGARRSTYGHPTSGVNTPPDKPQM